MAAGVRLLLVLLASHAGHGHAAVAPVEIGSFAPAATPSADIETVTASNFEEKVLRPVNSSAYMAMVLFPKGNFSLELYRNAKSRLDSSVRSREFLLFRPLRFFVMDCTNQANEEICRRHTKDRYPSLMCFRGPYVQRFNRFSWYQESVSYWVGRASRPAYIIVENMEQWLGQEAQAVPCFLLVVSKADPELLLRYEALAMELMEFQNFHLAVDDGGEKWKDLPGTRPSIHFIANKELHLEAPPFELAFDQDLLRSWVIISSMPKVRHQINFYMWELIPIGWSVVVLRHHGDHDAVERFQERAQAMREALCYSFVHLDVSTESGNNFAMTFFPLLAAYWEDYIPYFTDVQDPRIFVFTKTHAGGTLYWDSHYIDFPSPDDFQLEDVDKLMRKSPALDPIDFAEWPHWFLRYERFGGRSSVHRAIWLCAPFVSFYLFLYFSLWFFFFIRAIHESGLFSLLSLSSTTSQAAPERVKKPKKGKKSR